MKIVHHLPYIIVAGFAWIIIVSSCANQGMPIGGPRDTEPPVLLETQPGYKSLNFSGNEVRLTFNEFIIPDQISEVLVISPPLEKRPTILTKSKTLIVRFNQELRDDVTYSLDFKNSVVDNNERNPYENLRFTFSTGNSLDTLRVAGRVMDAFNLEPVENTLVLMYKNLHDSAVYTLPPDYISKTDENGMYLFDNLVEDEYRIYSINDVNNDLKYNEAIEKIAFLDSVFTPSAEYISSVDSIVAPTDTLLSGADTLLVEGHIHFSPGPVFLRQFTEKIFDQYVKTTKRDSRYTSTFVFNEPVRDTFNVRLLNAEADDWYILEPNQQFDSLTMWITDTTIAAMENISMELSYYQLDSLDQVFVNKDTIDMKFTEPTDTRSRRRNNDEEGGPPVPQFTWVTNLSSAFDLNKDILITSPQPLKSFDKSDILLYLATDTLKSPLNFHLEKDTSAWRTYRLKYPWEGLTSYILEIDSASIESIYGLTSKKLFTNFRVRNEDYYGSINLKLIGSPNQMLIQLLENNNRETIILEKIVENDKNDVTFDFLHPGKYKLKAVYDANNNKKWDTGSYKDKYQPERVTYYNEVIKIRSNWENNLLWNLEPDPTFVKNIRDIELEEQKRKEAELEELQQHEQQIEPAQYQQDNMFQDRISPGNIQP